VVFLDTAVEFVQQFTDNFELVIFDRIATAIYTMALPFTPDSSLIARHYRSCSCLRISGSSREDFWEEHDEFEHVISRDGKWVATVTEDMLSVFSVDTGTAIWSKTTTFLPDRLFFSSDGHILACVEDGMVQLFDATSEEARKIDIPAGDIYDFAFSPQNDHFAVVIQSENEKTRTVSIFRVEDGKQAWETYTQTPQVRYLPDGRFANVYQDGRTVDGCTGKDLGRDGLVFDQEKLGEDKILHISVSPDASLLAVVLHTSPNDISIWTVSPESVTTLKGHSNPVNCAQFSSDGTLLVSGSMDYTVRVWQCSSRTQTWSCIVVVYGHYTDVMDVAFLPDGKRIISESLDHTIRIWDISAAIEGREFEVEMDEDLPAVMGSWFRHAIPLGGWFYDQPFVFQHRFKLPVGVKPLDWNIFPEHENGDKMDEMDVQTDEHGVKEVNSVVDTIQTLVADEGQGTPFEYRSASLREA
jgi:hypothetical protein